MKFFIFFFIFFYKEISFTQSKENKISNRCNFIPITASAFYTYGNYSNQNSTNAKEFYLTLNDSIKSIHTFGFNELALNTEKEKNFFSQNIFHLRNAFWLGGNFSFATNYSLLIENSYVIDTVKYAQKKTYFVGGTIFYSLDKNQNLSLSNIISVSNDKILTHQLKFGYSKKLYDNINIFCFLLSSKSNENKIFLEKTPYLSNVEIEIEGKISDLKLKQKFSFGKKIFYFDETNLVLNNNREVQTSQSNFEILYNITKDASVIGNFSFQKFNAFSVKYFTIGTKFNL